MTMNNEEYRTIEDISEEKEEGLKIIEEDEFEENTNDITNYDTLEQEIEALEDLFLEEEIDFGFEEIANLLMLDEEQFKLLSEPFLFELEENIEAHKTIFALAAKQNDYQLEDFQNSFEEIRKEIYSSNELSQSKKDFILRIVGILFDAFFEEASFNKIISIPYELCREVTIPKYANNGDAGMDIYSPEEYTILPGETKIIPTGIKMAIPRGYAILIQPRSGQSLKTKLRIANTPGLIDSGYRDEIGVIIENIEPAFKDIEYDFDNNGEIHIKSILHGESYTITKGQRFAQMRLVETPTAALFPIENIEEIGEDRGGGFGSSGK